MLSFRILWTHSCTECTSSHLDSKNDTCCHLCALRIFESWLEFANKIRNPRSVRRTWWRGRSAWKQYENGIENGDSWIYWNRMYVLSFSDPSPTYCLWYHFQQNWSPLRLTVKLCGLCKLNFDSSPAGLLKFTKSCSVKSRIFSSKWMIYDDANDDDVPACTHDTPGIYHEPRYDVEISRRLLSSSVCCGIGFLIRIIAAIAAFILRHTSRHSEGHKLRCPEMLECIWMSTCKHKTHHANNNQRNWHIAEHHWSSRENLKANLPVPILRFRWRSTSTWPLKHVSPPSKMSKWGRS